MALQELITLLVFTAILYKSSEIVVENAARLAKFFRISQLAVGLLLIAVSTSLPELSVSVISSSGNHGAIAAGNVFGSNIANILLILGIGAFLYGFKIDKDSLADVAIVLLLTTAISAYILFHSQIYSSSLGLYEGILLLLIALWYGWHILGRKKIDGGKEEEERVTMQQGLRAFLLFGGGVLAVIISSSFVVDSAVKLAASMGLAQSFIGATIIAIGTSLPELSVDLQALRKKHYGLAVGDAIGSNMINITLVLGTAAVINPIVLQINVFIAALLFGVVANTVLFYFAAVKKKFAKSEGIFMLALFVLYIGVIFVLQAGEIAPI